MVAKIPCGSFVRMVRILLPQRIFCLFLLLRCQANIPACFPFYSAVTFMNFFLPRFTTMPSPAKSALV